ncbi:MAG: hypothetical protein ACHQCE_17740, partial [Streptosporangiales bacterium]
AGRFFELDHQVAAALALPDLGAAVKQVVRLLLEHSGDGLTDDVLLVLGEPVDRVTYQTLPRGHFRNAIGVAATGGQENRNGRPTSRYDPPMQR